MSFQRGSAEGQKATVTGSSMRGKLCFSMRVVKYYCRLHTCAIPDLRDSHNSAGQTTQQVTLTSKFAILWAGAGLDDFRVPLQPYFCTIPLKNAFYNNKKQSWCMPIQTSPLLLWMVYRCVCCQGWEKEDLPASIQLPIPTATTDSEGRLWMHTWYKQSGKILDATSWFAHALQSGKCTLDMPLNPNTACSKHMSQVLNTSDELKDFFYFLEVYMYKLD